MVAATKPLPATLLLVLERYGFVPNEDRTRWEFEGHESQACTIELVVEELHDDVAYQLSIAAFPGGEGFEDDTRYLASQLPQLELAIEHACTSAMEPYVKTRAQRLFEPWLGHDMAYALFYRRPKPPRS